MDLHDSIKNMVTVVFKERTTDEERIEDITRLMHLEMMAIASQYARHMRESDKPNYSIGFDEFIDKKYPIDK